MSVAGVISPINTQFRHPSTVTILPIRLHKPHTSLHCSNSSFLNPLRTTSPLSGLTRPIKPVTRKPTSIQMSMEAGVGLMGTKLGMMTYFEPTGKVVPVTVIGFREGNVVTQVKTDETDGYNAVQVGYRRVRDKKLTKPEMGHLEKSGVIPLRHLQEFRLQTVDGFEPNQQLVLEELFKEGDLVDVSGTTIGKGDLRVVMIKGAVPGKPGNLIRIAPAKIVGKNIPKN
ncbi:hypothetical protein M8C21_029458 [Ambrosia artemisiifolia]|uniref:50S ribosomal protein L3, chloroplastic n=1 Tax=Ambrosia artemisiifolia TaxID=4212 RepID=A0AAD5GUZ9_AMBAR|nr:hypothetical protein M8C21_029458 [Ambrosia artemisiifolia]